MNQIFKPLQAYNEFVIRIANVNGTGSASANGMIAKALFRMGLDIGPKNMFPSNIQGLPTWYEIRVSERGYTGRRGGVDLMVAMNPQTFSADIKELVAGGYLLFDSSRFIDSSVFREDIVVVGVPFSDIVRNEFPTSKAQLMLKNVVYAGVIGGLLGIPADVFVALLEKQFAAKAKLIPANIKALELGYKAASEHDCRNTFGLKVGNRELKAQRILLSGNDAAGLGCVYAGATVAGWYPITPSTSLVDAFSKYCAKYRVRADGSNAYAIIQAEDELAAIGMVLGAMWNGARAFTATSGPGISLMSEFLGYAYYAEIPAVIFNIQRCGPSTGMPTRTQQADLMLSAYASHGDTKHILLFPATPTECFEMSILAFDVAEKFQTPVFVMSDLELGMNEYICDPLRWDENHVLARGKLLRKKEVQSLTEPYYRYLDRDGDGVTYRTLPGDSVKGVYFTRGSGHDKFGRYTEDGGAYVENMQRIVKKFETATAVLPKCEILLAVKSNSLRKFRTVGVVAIGTSWEPLTEARDRLAEHGLEADYCRIRSFPFGPDLREFIKSHDCLYVIEQNRDAQLLSLMRIECAQELKVCVEVEPLCFYDGMPLKADDLVANLSPRLSKMEIRAESGV